jgi:hypothetical protein
MSPVLLLLVLAFKPAGLLFGKKTRSRKFEDEPKDLVAALVGWSCLRLCP